MTNKGNILLAYDELPGATRWLQLRLNEMGYSTTECEFSKTDLFLPKNKYDIVTFNLPRGTQENIEYTQNIMQGIKSDYPSTKIIGLTVGSLNRGAGLIWSQQLNGLADVISQMDHLPSKIANLVEKRISSK